MDDLNLASDFRQATREQWLERVEGVLRARNSGRSSSPARMTESRSRRSTEGGRVCAGRARAGRAPARVQRVDDPEPAKANELALLHSKAAPILYLVLPVRPPHAVSVSGSTMSRTSTGRCPA